MKNKYAEIQNTKANIDSSPISWQNRQFSYPARTIRLATSFSGIGAIEHAFHRLGLNCEIQFAGDIDENCKKAYFANYSIREEQWHTDVHNFDARPFKGKVDLFVGAEQHCAHMLPAAFTAPAWSVCSTSCGRRNSTALNATTPTIRKKEHSACCSIAKSTVCLSAVAATAMVHLCRGDVWDSLWSLPICCAWTAFCRRM